jgi:hypothetical protein
VIQSQFISLNTRLSEIAQILSMAKSITKLFLELPSSWPEINFHPQKKMFTADAWLAPLGHGFTARLNSRSRSERIVKHAGLAMNKVTPLGPLIG